MAPDGQTTVFCPADTFPVAIYILPAWIYTFPAQIYIVPARIDTVPAKIYTLPASTDIDP